MSATHYKITILGCGDSAGVPRIGGDWGECDPANPKNRRTRPSILVQSDTTTVVVDTGPDFGLQLTRENIRSVDAVLYTHDHSDHITGMDDLRILQARRDLSEKIPIHLDQPTLRSLRKKFDYMFEQSSTYYPVVVDPVVFDETKFGTVHKTGDIDYIPFLQDHGQGNRSIGFRFGDIGYSTDMRNLDEAALSVLKGVRIWIADCADFSHGHNTLHADFPAVQRLNAVIGAEQVYLTHLKMFYDYQTMVGQLPRGYSPCHDGLVLRGG